MLSLKRAHSLFRMEDPMPGFRQGRLWASLAFVAALSSIADATPFSAPGAESQARIAADIAAGRPVVVHLVVALCDNKNQGIVPVPRSLGNGQDPRSNLYWGARFGVRGYFGRERGTTGSWISRFLHPIDQRHVRFPEAASSSRVPASRTSSIASAAADRIRCCSRPA